METQQAPRYPISTEQLADWVDEQGDACYWSVDGERLLSGRLSVPCPGDELAAELRKVSKPLWVLDPREAPQPLATGKGVSPLDDLVEEKELDTRVLLLSWEESGKVWLLIEDEETSDSVNREACAQRGNR